MTTYRLEPRRLAPVYYEPKHKPVPQLQPIQIDEGYFDRLAVFGLACLAAAIVGKLVLASLRR